MKSSKKKLLVSGCSFTSTGNNTHEIVANNLKMNRDKDGNILYKLPKHKKWPEIVSEQLDLKLVNLAVCGFSNERIVDSTINYIFKNGHDDIEMVLIGLSEFSRERIRYWDPTGQDLKSVNNKGGNLMDINARWVLPDLDDIQKFEKKVAYGKVNIFNVIRNIFLLQEFLKSRNIKYKFFPLMNVEESMIPFFEIFKQRDPPIMTYRDSEDKLQLKKMKLKVITTLIKDPYFQNIDEEHFYGWPLIKELGANILELDESELICPKYRDFHPNEKGHQKIAKEVLGFL